MGGGCGGVSEFENKLANNKQVPEYNDDSVKRDECLVQTCAINRLAYYIYSCEYLTLRTMWALWRNFRFRTMAGTQQQLPEWDEDVRQKETR